MCLQRLGAIVTHATSSNAGQPAASSGAGQPAASGGASQPAQSARTRANIRNTRPKAKAGAARQNPPAPTQRSGVWARYRWVMVESRVAKCKWAAMAGGGEFILVASAGKGHLERTPQSWCALVVVRNRAGDRAHLPRGDIMRCQASTLNDELLAKHRAESPFWIWREATRLQ